MVQCSPQREKPTGRELRAPDLTACSRRASGADPVR